MNTRRPTLTHKELYLPDEDATIALAQQLAPMLAGTHPAMESSQVGGRIHLRGDLGAGKTSFARALLRACGVAGRIKSPSYALVESYNLSNLQLYHLDFYRFKNSREWVDAGFRDILQEKAVVLIEWPENAGSLLPPPDLQIDFEYAGTGRHVRLTAHSKKGTSWLTTLNPNFQAYQPPDTPGADC